MERRAGQPAAPTLVLGGNEGGGARNSVRILLANLLPADRPRVVALAEGGLTDALRQAGLEVHVLGRRGPRALREPGTLLPLRIAGRALYNLAWVLLRAVRLARWLRRHAGPRPLVHTNPGYPLFVALAAGALVPFRYVCHWRAVWKPRARLLDWATGRRVDRFVAISEAVRRSLPPAWRRKAVVIHNGIEVRRLAEEARRRRGELRDLAAVTNGTPLVLCVATYAPHKGQHLLVEAMKTVAAARPEALAVFVGATTGSHSREYLRSLQRQAERLGVAGRCRFLTDVPAAGALFADAAVAAVPTWGPGEGFGLVAVEAMACGRPVVAFRAGAAEEVIEDGRTGTLVPSGDDEALARAIVALLDDPARARRMGRAGRRRAAERFDAPIVAREVSRLYRRLQGGP